MLSYRDPMSLGFGAAPLRLLCQLLLFLPGKVKCQLHDLISHAPVIRRKTQVSGICCDVLLLLRLAIPVDGLP